MTDRDDAPAGGRPDIDLAWYGVALVIYIVAGFFTKSVVLNWIVGPLFPLLALYLIPRLFRRRKSPEPAE